MESQELLVEIFLLIFLLAFVVFVFFAIKSRSSKIIGNQGITEELERYYFSPKKFISIIKIGEEIFTIGVTEQEINFLKEIKDKETREELKLIKIRGNKNKKFSDFFTFSNDNYDSIKSRLKKMRNDNE